MKPVITEVKPVMIDDFDPIVNGNQKYPWTQTLKGMSIPFPTTVKSLNVKTQIYSANKRYKHLGIKFVYRTKNGISYAHCLDDGIREQIRSIA
ncbi:MAG: hypothetical protein ACXV2C_00535 [Candidatus Bathyarchaeia archaeon]